MTKATEKGNSVGRLLYLSALAMVASLVLVPAALAESETGTHCANFSGTAEDRQNQAQALLEQNPNDPNGLDADGDGTACEFTSSAQSGVTFEDGTGYISGAEVAPVTPPLGAESPVFQPAEPDAAVLPDTGGPSRVALLLPAAGLLLATGLVGLKVVRRRS